jgi:hypothetical protein
MIEQRTVSQPKCFRADFSRTKNHCLLILSSIVGHAGFGLFDSRSSAVAQQVIPAGQVKPLVAAPAAVPMEPRVLDRIPPGTVIGENDATEFSNLLFFVKGQLSEGDVSEVSSTVKYYADLFNLVYLANVKQVEGRYELDKVAIGFSTLINEKRTVITSDTAKQLGLRLSFIGGSVLSGNEDALDDLKIVAQNRTSMVIDAPSVMLWNGEHLKMLARYFVWVSPKSGKVGTVVWLLEKKADEYSFAQMQVNYLQTPMVEDRIMHVDGDEFTFGIPSPQAFAIVSLPCSKAFGVTENLARVGSTSKFTDESLTELAQLLSEALQKK